MIIQKYSLLSMPVRQDAVLLSRDEIAVGSQCLDVVVAADVHNL